MTYCELPWMNDPTISDSEFWDLVFNRDDKHPEIEDYEPEHEMSIAERDVIGFLPLAPCPECNQTDACGYDDEGRPWIHLAKDHDE